MHPSNLQKNRAEQLFRKFKDTLLTFLTTLINIDINRTLIINYKFTIYSLIQTYTILLTQIYSHTTYFPLSIISILFLIMFILIEYNYKFTKSLVKIKCTIFFKYNIILLFVLLLNLQKSFKVSILTIVSSESFVESFTKRGCRVFFSEVLFGVFLRCRRSKGSVIMLLFFVLVYFSWVYYFYNFVFMVQEVFLIFLFYFSLFITSSHRRIMSPVLSVIINTTFLMYFFTSLDLLSYNMLFILDESD